MNKTCLILAATGLVAASVSVAQAQIAIAGAFNGWDNTGVPSPGGGPPIYTNIMTGGTPGNINEFKWIANSGSWSLGYPNSGNQKVLYDAGGSNTVYLYSQSFVDGWNPVANRVGYEDPGGMTWELAGSFNGWSGGAGWNLNSIGNGVYSNTIVFPTAGSYDGKFRKQGGWDYEFGDSGNNIAFIITSSPQSVSVQLDVKNGRYTIGEPVPVLVTNAVVFAVDMTSQIQLGNFHPDQGYSTFVAGSFNGFPGPGGGVKMTNYPAYNGGSNTNIYYGTNLFVHTATPVSYQYKFNQNDPAAPNGGWETSNNQNLNLPAISSTINLPVKVFSDFYADGFLTAPTPVQFSVDMNGAVGTDGSVFNPVTDLVYINGEVTTPQWYSWYVQNPPNPIDPAPVQFMMVQSNNSTIYTNTIVLPAGTPLKFKYKYGMATNGIVNPLDNEAGSFNDHMRVARNTSFNPYVLATDKFGVMYGEPLFTGNNTAGGELAVGPASGGTIPVKWLGRPGAQLQTSTSLTGSWQTVPGTDGTNWMSGTQSTNGFVSTTNWPSGGNNVFFRLFKPN